MLPYESIMSDNVTIDVINTLLNLFLTVSTIILFFIGTLITIYNTERSRGVTKDALKWLIWANYGLLIFLTLSLIGGAFSFLCLQGWKCLYTEITIIFYLMLISILVSSFFLTLKGMK